MATTLQKGLFGGDPVAIQQAEQQRWANMYGQAGSPYEKMGLALGQLGGKLFGGADPAATKASAINKALQNAAAKYQQGTAEYYKAVAEDPSLAEYPDSKEFAMQKFAETKAKNQEVFIASSKAVADNPDLVGEFTAPLAASLLAKAEAAGWDKTKTPVPTTSAEISAFAKEFNLTRDPDYGRYLSLTKIAEKEAKKEGQQEEKRLLDIKSIKSTIAKNEADLNKIIKDEKFDAGARWNEERLAALALFEANKIDPTKPLKGINLANTELVNAQKIALRNPFPGKATTKPATPGGDAKMTPVPLPASKTALNIGQVYATPNGNAQWDGSKFNLVAK